MDPASYTSDMPIGEIVRSNARNIGTRESRGGGCAGRPASQSGPLADACMVHGTNASDVLAPLELLAWFVEYVHLVQRHMQKENDGVRPFARRAVSGEVVERLTHDARESALGKDSPEGD